MYCSTHNNDCIVSNTDTDRDSDDHNNITTDHSSIDNLLPFLLQKQVRVRDDDHKNVTIDHTAMHPL